MTIKTFVYYLNYPQRRKLSPVTCVIFVVKGPTPATNLEKDMCLLTRTAAELPSGIVIPYLKFKTISAYLPADLKSDTRIVLDGKSMSCEQFQRTLRVYGCSDLLQDVDATAIHNYVSLEDGTQVAADDYRNVVVSLAAGSETVAVSDAFRGPYSAYRTLLSDVLPELAASAFVISPAGFVIPFSMYRAVELELNNGTAGSSPLPPPAPETIKWHDGRSVTVDTVRRVIDALSARPESISYVFPNRVRLPFMPDGRDEPPPALYDCDPERVAVDVGMRENVPMSLFNDIVRAAHIPDECCTGAYNMFDVVRSAGDPTKRGRLAIRRRAPDGKRPAATKPAASGCGLGPGVIRFVVSSSAGADEINVFNAFDGEKPLAYSVADRSAAKTRNDTALRSNGTDGSLIFVANKHAKSDTNVTVFGPVSAMEKTDGSDGSDRVKITISRPSGATSEINILNALGNAKPLICDGTDEPVDLQGLKGRASTLMTDYSPVIACTCGSNASENSTTKNANDERPTKPHRSTTTATDVKHGDNRKPCRIDGCNAATTGNKTSPNPHVNGTENVKYDCSKTETDTDTDRKIGTNKTLDATLMDQNRNKTRAKCEQKPSEYHDQTEPVKTENSTSTTPNCTVTVTKKNNNVKYNPGGNEATSNSCTEQKKTKITLTQPNITENLTNDSNSVTNTSVPKITTKRNDRTELADTNNSTLTATNCTDVQNYNKSKPIVGCNEDAVKLNNGTKGTKNITVATTDPNEKTKNVTSSTNTTSGKNNNMSDDKNRTKIQNLPPITTKNCTAKSDKKQSTNNNRVKPTFNTTKTSSELDKNSISDFKANPSNSIKTNNQTELSKIKNSTLDTSNWTISNTNDTEPTKYFNTSIASETNTVWKKNSSEINNRTNFTDTYEQPATGNRQTTIDNATKYDNGSKPSTDKSKKVPTKIGTTVTNNNYSTVTSPKNNETTENLTKSPHSIIPVNENPVMSNDQNVTETYTTISARNSTGNTNEPSETDTEIKVNPSDNEVKTAETKAATKKFAKSTDNVNSIFKTNAMNKEYSKLNPDQTKTTDTKNTSISAPSFTEVIKNPNNGSITNNKVVNIIVC